MPSTDIANLARQFGCCVPDGMDTAVSTYLLAQIVLTSNPSFDMSASSILNGARRFNCCVPPGMETAVMNYLLNEIFTNGGANGNPYYNMALAGAQPPSDGSVPKYLVFDTDRGFKWYNSGTLASPTWNSI